MNQQLPTPTAVSLPVLTPMPARPLRVTPTDVSQFVRLEQCERFLRLRLSERAGLPFMEEFGVMPQRITPLLSLSGKTFERYKQRGTVRRRVKRWPRYFWHPRRFLAEMPASVPT